MANSTKNILFIVEGEKDEVTFLKKIWDVYFGNSAYNYKIYVYNTSIYELYEDIMEDPEYLAVLSILKSKEIDEDRKRILGQKFTDIFLIFD